MIERSVHKRLPAVAGFFYPSDLSELQQSIKDCMSAASFIETQEVNAVANPPKALIVPHAGYIYSGLTAGLVYSKFMEQLNNSKIDPQTIKRIVILGPAHRFGFEGIAGTKVDFFTTPFGDLPVDLATMDKLVEMGIIQINEQAYLQEHCLEVQLPFLQTIFTHEFSIVPLLVGRVDIDNVTAVLHKVWDGAETIVIVSSDLSHYHEYKMAESLDRETVNAIENLEPDQVGRFKACGYMIIQGLLTVARQKKLIPKLIDYRNSGDTVGDKNRVVGYAGFHFYEQQKK